MKEDIEKLKEHKINQLELIKRLIKKSEPDREAVNIYISKKVMVEQFINDLTEVLKNSENTEGVSDATHKSGVLHDVGESHASGENCKSDLASGELPLKKITDSENKFSCYEIHTVQARMYGCATQCKECKDRKLMEES